MTKKGKEIHKITTLPKKSNIKEKHEAKDLSVKTKTKAALKNTRLGIIKGLKPSTLSFAKDELPIIEKALDFKISKLNKRVLGYKISMLSVEALEQAEDIAAGVGARLFATLKKGEKEKPAALGQIFKKNDILTVHFRGNETAESNYGMHHLFKNQPKIQKVNIIEQTSKRGEGKEGLATRRSDGKFYFEDGSYAPIFTGTKVEIKHIYTEKELKESKKIKAPKSNFLKPTNRTTSSSPMYENNPLDTTEIVERKKQFRETWERIQKTNSKSDLIAIKHDIHCLSDDPIVVIPNEKKRSNGKRFKLRTGAALRYALFKKYASLSGHKVRATSAYRSVEDQAKLWNIGLKKRLKEFRTRREAIVENGKYVARPGKSHHNTGGAIDFHIQGLPMYKYKGSRSKYMKAIRRGSARGFSGDDRKAIRTRLIMDKKLKASYFLGQNYFRETWHWNIDRENGRKIYKNV